ncbi:MAG TPA: hypothetical protein VF322_03590 [Gammaproteobacteria bacterium]
MQREILDEIEALPGVAAAGFASQLPLEWVPQDASIVVEGQPAAVGSTPPRKIKYVSPGYFEAMGTRIIAGRDIT